MLAVPVGVFVPTVSAFCQGFRQRCRVLLPKVAVWNKLGKRSNAELLQRVGYVASVPRGTCALLS